MIIVKIYPCKECGCDEGYQIEEHLTLAECKMCQHLCDVNNILGSIGFIQTDNRGDTI